MILDFRQVKPESFTSEKWKHYHLFRRKIHNQRYPDEPIIPDEVIETQLKNSNSLMNLYYFLVYNGKIDSSPICQITFAIYKKNTPSYENHKETLIYFFDLLKKFSTEEHLSKILHFISEKAEEFKKSVITTEITDKLPKKFLDSIGVKPKAIGVVWHFPFDSMDWNLIKDWKKEVERSTSEFNFHFYSSIPESIINPFCDLCTEVMDQIPRGELVIEKRIIVPENIRERENDCKKAGMQITYVVIIDSQNHPLAFTEFYYTPGQIWIDQNLIGVHKNVRGRKLGKWLMVASLLNLREEHSNVKGIKNYIYKSNIPMTNLAKLLNAKIYEEKYVLRNSVNELKNFLNESDNVDILTN